jgi:hypothetical protein
MFAHSPASLLRNPVAAALLAAALLASPAVAADTVTVGGLALVNKGLVGVGRIPADQRDTFGETFGSGSGLAADVQSWTRTADGYSGTFYLLPDRGYNVSGTTDYRARLYKLSIAFKPVADPSAIAEPDRQRSVVATLAETIPLTDAAGESLTGLDPAEGGVRPAAQGFPDLPQAKTGHVAVDAEALVRMPDGSFFISDEYGPYIYRFSAQGRLLSAIRPPDAFIPMRNGKQNFSSNNPGPRAPAPTPKDPDTGRQNNQGFEGMALTPDGRFLVVILQSATRQDGGDTPETRQNTRILYYDIADLENPKLVREHVVPLPFYQTTDGKTRVAAQSELLALDETHFLLLARDSGNGYGYKPATSLYRKIGVLDTSNATNIAGSQYDGVVPVAPKGKIAHGVVPARLTAFIDINDNTELNKFGLRNGAPNDRDNLSEKWEGMTLVPALDPAAPQDFFLFISNDNDFITQNGYQVGAAYKDESGADIDTLILVYRVTLPRVAQQAVGLRQP